MSKFKIDRFEVWRVRVPLRATMRSSRGSIDQGEKVIFRLTTSCGATGLGEASVIFPGRSGENAESIFLMLRDVFGPDCLGKDPLDHHRILDSLSRHMSEAHGFLATLCAVDLALHDLKARLLGVPVAQLLGGAARERMPLSRSISIMPDDQLVEAAMKLSEQGYRLLTLKGTKDWEADIQTYHRVREAVPPHVMLEFDPNQAWTPKGALMVDRATSATGLLCIEQPCGWWDLEGMQFVTQRARTMIAADETVLSPVDVMRVIRMGAADVITIKLAKSGGIRPSAVMVEMAKAAGIECNMGSKHPLGVGAAALLHFAAAYPEVGQFIGYGSARERFVDDVIAQDIVIDGGDALLPQGNGFGVSLNEEAVRRLSLEHHDSTITHLRG